jgi:class 3 adenylate cyclase
MLGIIGEQNRLQCTVISDAVNVASRVESLTKTYKTSLIITESTYKQLTEPSLYVIRFLDNIRVKGRSERVKLFAVEKYNFFPK